MRRRPTFILLILALVAPLAFFVLPAQTGVPAPLSARAADADVGASGSEAERKGKKDRKRGKDKKNKPKKDKKPPVPTCFGKKATITLKGNEETVGTDNDDVIIGDGKSNQIDLVGEGVDRVCTGGGNDSVRAPESNRLLAAGGPGRDTLLSAANGGSDLLLGDEGNDFLIAGDGDDDLFGGEGNDRLVGAAGLDILDGGPGVDLCLQENDSEAFNC